MASRKRKRAGCPKRERTPREEHVELGQPHTTIMGPEAMIAHLAQSLPLAQKLEAQQFAYECVEEDIEKLVHLEVLAEAVEADLSLTGERFQEMFQKVGLTAKQMTWLLCLLQTDSQELRRNLAARPAKPYRPLAERVQAVQQGILFSQAQGILHIQDDPEIVALSGMAERGPRGLMQAERLWSEFNRGVDGLDEE